MKTLLDTCVVSELRHPRGNPTVMNAVQAIPAWDVFLSVITIGELEKGITLLKQGHKKRELAQWLRRLQAETFSRILEVDAQTAQIWGELTARLQQQGRVVNPPDGLIAATALRHGLRIFTRNTGHFEGTGALIVNPWL